MNEIFKLIVVIAAGFIIVLGGIVYPLETLSCKARWAGNPNVEATDFSLLTNCRIKIDGAWLPEDRYRVQEK